jgi:hypothetical protein
MGVAASGVGVIELTGLGGRADGTVALPEAGGTLDCACFVGMAVAGDRVGVSEEAGEGAAQAARRARQTQATTAMVNCLLISLRFRAIRIRLHRQ